MWDEKLHVGVPYCKILKGKNTMKIEDNFLKQEDFDRIQTIMGESSDSFPWFYTNAIDSQDDVDKFQFVHKFYGNQMPVSPCMNDLTPILDIIKPLILI